MVASLDRHLEILQLLLQSGAVVDFRSNDGVDLMRLLLQSGVAMDCCDNRNLGWTPSSGELQLCPDKRTTVS